MRQEELIKQYKEIEKFDYPIDINTREGQRLIKDMMWRVVEELGEAANCLKNKPWKQSQLETDEEHFMEELSDAIHFFVELFIICGYTADDFFNIYCRKFEVNKFRIRSKY